MPKEKSCGTIIFRKNEGEKLEFLLLHYASGHWDFPKGHVENEETEEATAIRELEEETGITKARIIPGFRAGIQYYYKKQKQTVSKEVFFFLLETKEKKVKLSKEHTGFKWLEKEEAMAQITFANSKEILQKALEFLEKTGK